jgi:hypothetical protein
MKPLLGIALLILSAAALAVQDRQCNQDASRQEVQKLTAVGMIISIGQFLPYVTAVVDRRRWSRSTLEQKTAMAHHIDCAIADPNSVMLRTIIFRSNKDNQALGVYSLNELKFP